MIYIKKYWKAIVCAIAMLLVAGGILNMANYRFMQHRDFEQRLHIARHLASRPSSVKTVKHNKQ